VPVAVLGGREIIARAGDVGRPNLNSLDQGFQQRDVRGEIGPGPDAEVALWIADVLDETKTGRDLNIVCRVPGEDPESGFSEPLKHKKATLVGDGCQIDCRLVAVRVR